MYVCIFHYFSYYLLDFVLPFVWGTSFLSCFCVFVLIPFNAITNHLWNLHYPARDQALSLWSGSADSKTLDYQRTPNPREY